MFSKWHVVLIFIEFIIVKVYLSKKNNSWSTILPLRIESQLNTLLALVPFSSWSAFVNKFQFYVKHFFLNDKKVALFHDPKSKYLYSISFQLCLIYYSACISFVKISRIYTLHFIYSSNWYWTNNLGNMKSAGLSNNLEIRLSL